MIANTLFRLVPLGGSQAALVFLMLTYVLCELSVVEGWLGTNGGWWRPLNLPVQLPIARIWSDVVSALTSYTVGLQPGCTASLASS